MKFVNYLIVMATVIAISACSNTPSELDAKKSVESMLGGCRFLSIENFEQLNGVSNSDGSHVLEVKYTIKATAFPEIAKMAIDYSTKWSGISERLEKAIEADAAAKKESTDRNHKLQSEIKDMNDWNYFKAETDKFDKEVALPANQLVSAIYKERDNLESEKLAISQKFMKECPSMNERLQYLLYDNNLGLDNYTKDFTRGYQVQLQMVKTDNGWMSAN